MIKVRPAQPGDAQRICDIWNEIIRDTLITFTSKEKTVALISDMFDARGPAFLVCHGADQQVCGFATYGEFRSGPGYAFTKEHTIMLAPAARGQGAGSALLRRLERVAQDEKIHSFVAAISGENLDGIRFHLNNGFERVGTIPQTGFKDAQWIDLVLMQKFIELRR